MSETNAIEVAVRANASQYVATMKEAGGVTTSATSQMGSDLAALGGAAEEAEAPFQELTHHIRGMRQEMFLGNFMARQITELGAASKETAGMVAGLAGAFLVGNWTGLAVEGVLKLIGAFNDLGKESQKAAEEAIKSIGELHEKVETYLASLRKETELEKIRRTELAPLEEKESAQKADLIAKTDALATAQNQLNKAAALGATGATLIGLQLGVDLRARAVEQAQKLLDLTQLQINAGKKELEGAGKETTSTHAIEAQEKLQDEFNAYSQKKYEQDLDAWKKLQDEKEKAVEERNRRIAKAEGDSAAAIRKMLEEQDKARLEQQMRLQSQQDAEDKRRAAALKRTADQIASSATSALRAVVDGSKSAGDAIKGLFEDVAFEVIGTLVRLGVEAIATSIAGTAAAKAEATSTTQGHIAEAIAGAYASQAFIPFVGPELGAAAAAQAGLFLEGVTAPMLSAAGGLGEVPRDGTIIRAHEKETMLPAYIATPMRKMFAEGEMPGGGGGDVHNHFHFPNAVIADEQGMRRLVESQAFRNAMRGARRLGRAP